MIREYKTIGAAAGSLVTVSRVEGAACGELAEVELSGGETRRGIVLEMDGGTAIVRLFGNSAGINLKESKARFMGRGLELAVSEDMLGRVFDGLGRPLDGGPALLAEAHRDINTLPLNPLSRECPGAFVETGISAIDGPCPLALGQSMAIFSGLGLPHAPLAAQIARQARLQGGEPDFTVVFAAIGTSFDEAEYFVQEFRRTGAIDRTVLFTNLAGDPVAERLAVPRVALTAAEYLAFEKDMHVLVILTDLTNYADALREISAARMELPGRRGYPLGLRTELASLFERAGRRVGKTGSITVIPVLTMPDDDISHPAADLTGYMAEGRIVLSRELFKKGVTPPVDILPSRSRLMDKCSGEGKTREDHTELMTRLAAAYASGKQARETGAILGKSALSEPECRYAALADELENNYVNQSGDLSRSIEETLDLGWRLLSGLPDSELSRVNAEFIDKYLPKGNGE